MLDRSWDTTEPVGSSGPMPTKDIRSKLLLDPSAVGWHISKHFSHQTILARCSGTLYTPPVGDPSFHIVILAPVPEPVLTVPLASTFLLFRAAAATAPLSDVAAVRECLLRRQRSRRWG